VVLLGPSTGVDAVEEVLFTPSVLQKNIWLISFLKFFKVRHYANKELIHIKVLNKYRYHFEMPITCCWR
jgi:hypothetical protein